MAARAALATLATHPCGAVSRSEAHFHEPGAPELRIRGLTPILARVMPIADHDMASCGCARRSALQRRAGVCQPGRSSRKFRADLGGSPAALAAFDAARRADRVSCVRGVSETGHGSFVDDELSRFISNPTTRVRDPCTVSVLSYVREQGWRPLATQVNMRSRQWRFATAADLVCETSRGGLVLVEVKATRRFQSTPCYEAKVDGAHSAYEVHQAQLYAMWRILEREVGVRVEKALVLRVSRRDAVPYPLNSWCRENDALIASWFV